MQKKILLLSTGGTIASVVSEAGLVPKESGEQLINMLGELPYDITVEDILQLDSSNIQPEEWKLIAEKIYGNRNKYVLIPWPIQHPCFLSCYKILTSQLF